MFVKSFGCSFIFGTDLADVDSTRGEPYSAPSRLSWPSLLAQSLGYDYQCHARPGSGNLRIMEKILSQSSQESALFVINWSWIDRFDYTVTYPDRHHHVYDEAGTELWKTIVPVDTSSQAQNYYKDLHSQYRDKLASLTYIHTAITALNFKQIPFIMTYMDDLLFETQWHVNQAIIELQNSIRPYLITFEGMNFLDWSKSRGFPISETMHPLEPAHQAAFEYIKNHHSLELV